MIRRFPCIMISQIDDTLIEPMFPVNINSSCSNPAVRHALPKLRKQDGPLTPAWAVSQGYGTTGPGIGWPTGCDPQLYTVSGYSSNVNILF